MAVVDIPNNTTTTARFDGDPIILATFSGELETFGDRDWVAVTLTAGVAYQFFGSVETAGANAGDAAMRLLGPDGTQIAANDDDPLGGLNSFIGFTAVTSGTYYIEIRSLFNYGGDYALIATSLASSRQVLTTGDDIFVGDGTTSSVVQGYFGDDTITIAGATIDAFGEQGDDTIYGNNSSNYISGGMGNDSVLGGDGGDRIFGDSGHDYINGGDGDDRIYGGSGNDLLYGLLGNDTFFVDEGDYVWESAGQGSDRAVVQSTFFYLAAGSQIENLQAETPTSTAMVNIVGNEIAQLIVGNNGINTLNGGGGADILRGLGGNDFYYVDSTDTIDETAGNGTLDRVLSSTAFTLGPVDKVRHPYPYGG